MTNRPIGNGALFEMDARTRFMEATKERYRLMELRNKRKELPPLPFTVEVFRGRVYDAMGRKWDGVITCRYCRKPCDFADVDVDHAIPLDRGGDNGLDNLEFPCHADNLRKGRLLPDEYEKLIEFLETKIPLGRTDVLSRLQKAVSLAASARNNFARIKEFKDKGQWKKKKKTAPAEEPF